MSAELAPARIIRTAPVPGYEEFYRVSEEGDVFRLARTFVDKRCGSRTHAPRLLRPVVVAGYKYVMLTDGKATHKRLAVHRIVASVFCPNPSQKPEVNHLNGDRGHNHFKNLEWVTRSENQNHAVKAGLKPWGQASHLAKLAEEDVREIRRLSAAKKPQHEIAAMFGVSQTCISKIVTGKKWKLLAA
jgi:hypothetical protein